MKAAAGLIKLLAGVLAIGAIGIIGYESVTNRQISSAAAEEARRQKPEIVECRERLAQLYQAWFRYRKEHRQAPPPDLESLISGYIKPEMLACPTATYWMEHRFTMEQGVVTVNRRNYPVTYGARWLTGGYAYSVKRDRERAPLVVCESHGEALFKVAYKRRPPLGAFSEEQRVKWVPEVRNAKALAVLTNGAVVEVDPASI